MTITEVKQWVAAAVADGWSIKPTYGKHESVDTAASLEKNGFKAIVLARPKGPIGNWGHRKHDETDITIWGPDGLQLSLNYKLYNWQEIENAVKICMYCKGVGKTVRIGFAGRCCPACREKHVSKVEYPGWCD